jgi:hypothetical protein
MNVFEQFVYKIPLDNPAYLNSWTTSLIHFEFSQSADNLHSSVLQLTRFEQTRTTALKRSCDALILSIPRLEDQIISVCHCNLRGAQEFGGMRTLMAFLPIRASSSHFWQLGKAL